MGMGTARESGDQNAGNRNVIDKTASAPYQRLVFEAKNACANHAHWPALEIALAALARMSLGVA